MLCINNLNISGSGHIQPHALNLFYKEVKKVGDLLEKI